MNEQMNEQTNEQTTPAQHYKAALDSVGLINRYVDQDLLENQTLEEKREDIKRNVDHLRLILGRVDWTNAENLNVLKNAAAAGDEWLADN
jgi:uncharacterized UPF0160 family protein